MLKRAGAVGFVYLQNPKLLELPWERVVGSSKEPTVVFALVTGEEKGLLGSRYFTARPPVPITSLVADFNLDMFMPHWPFTAVVAHGKDGSTLVGPLTQVAREQGIQVLEDPEPDRNLFIRSDQYSFIREGVPALYFKFGYTPGSAEQKLFKQWVTQHYHAPSDDLTQQPVDREGAARYIAFLTALTDGVADAPERPRWNDDSFFRRFAKP